MLFENFDRLIRIALMGVLAYSALVLLLRVTGKRTLSKMNAFDLVVTVALGSTLASVILSKDITLADGVTALTVLVGLQYVIAWLAARFKIVNNLIKSEPTLVVYQGEYLYEAIKKQRLTPEEVRAAVRGQGIATVANVDSVILETEGSLTVISDSDFSDKSILVDVADQVPNMSSKKGDNPFNT